MLVPAVIVNIYNLHYTMTSTATQLHTRCTVTHALGHLMKKVGHLDGLRLLSRDGTSWLAQGFNYTRDMHLESYWECHGEGAICFRDQTSLRGNNINKYATIMQSLALGYLRTLGWREKRHTIYCSFWVHYSYFWTKRWVPSSCCCS